LIQFIVCKAQFDSDVTHDLIKFLSLFQRGNIIVEAFYLEDLLQQLVSLLFYSNLNVIEFAYNLVNLPIGLLILYGLVESYCLFLFWCLVKVRFFDVDGLLKGHLNVDLLNYSLKNFHQIIIVNFIHPCNIVTASIYGLIAILAVNFVADRLLLRFAQKWEISAPVEEFKAKSGFQGLTLQTTTIGGYFLSVTPTAERKLIGFDQKVCECILGLLTLNSHIPQVFTHCARL
jgi:hypothetical protein